MISAKNYDYSSWKFDSTILVPDNGWLQETGEVPKEILEKLCSETKQGITIFPYLDLVFKAFELERSDVNIVIVGQDPYFNFEFSNGKLVPQAMGMSFSVPIEIKIPPSLNNIYKNLVKYKHLRQIPKHGNLEKIASQGVLFLNSALTVQQGYNC
jgi:uracil-DNA glycosylase